MKQMKEWFVGIDCADWKIASQLAFVLNPWHFQRFINAFKQRMPKQLYILGE